jgi:hypothetical protein
MPQWIGRNSAHLALVLAIWFMGEHVPRPVGPSWRPGFMRHLGAGWGDGLHAHNCCSACMAVPLEWRPAGEPPYEVIAPPPISMRPR